MGRGRPRKFLSKEKCLAAMSKTRSNRAAARYLHVSFHHYKKYAKLYKDEETGKTLWELHMNEAGKGIPKFLSGKGKEPPLMDILEGRAPIYNFKPSRIKQRIIEEGIIEECCSRCSFEERREIDFRVPLILHHKNGNKEDFRVENLEFMCYNCSFLYAISPISDKQVEKMEDYVDKTVKDYDWELDELDSATKEHLQKIFGETKKDEGSDFIDYQ